MPFKVDVMIYIRLSIVFWSTAIFQ